MAKRTVSRMARLASKIAAIENNIQWQINACEKLMVKLEPLLEQHDEIRSKIRALQAKASDISKMKLNSEVTVTRLLTDLHLVRGQLNPEQEKQVTSLTKRFTKQ